ncbi:probable cytochrome P450 9f2 [Rhagoletis pomonella]|uniref:probable cytochrome P450 9f2 n=1 Tax=Rhagoletis pomonella TaxID=28610 RepID=UPI0017845AEE|nr:probable cytochrome P450 9f2 [Rhagoletis pomonella]
MWFVLFILGAAFIYQLYRWATANFDFFEKRQIPYDKPFPMFGSFKSVTLRRRSMFDTLIDLYNQHKGGIYGVFYQTTPIFLIRDIDLVRQITVKDFDHFMNHNNFFGEDSHDLLANSLFLLKNDKWKDMRSTLSPAFTGSRLRQMFELINQVAEDSTNYLHKLHSKESCNGIELDFKDYATRFTNDAIASTAFGLQVNSFEQKDNTFYMMGKKANSSSFWVYIRLLLFTQCKRLAKLLRIEFVDKNSTKYFRHLVLDAFKYRKERNIRRPDMINLLMEARGLFPTDSPKAHNREWTDTEMVAQCFIFFLGGFDTMSTLICFAAYELMANPDVQEKLFEEVEELNKRREGKRLTYEDLHAMKYLEMVVNETMRKWPPIILLNRICTKDFLFEANGERKEIKKDEIIMIPVSGIHRDPQYYPNPDNFDPERFSAENKDKIKPFTFIPFGEGPRNCIASRFAPLEAKAILYYLVRDFRITAAKKTILPIELEKKGLSLAPINGFWLKLIARNKI